MRGADVTAVVLASRGGPRLARALESVAWARARTVLDPARRLAAEPLPGGVSSVAAEPVATTSWVLLLCEGEVVPRELAAAIGVALADPAAPAAFRVPVEQRSVGTRLRLRGAPVRMARTEGARVVVGPTLEVGLKVPGRHPGRLAAAIVAPGASTLTEAVDDLEGDAAALAALLGRLERRAGVRHLLVAPLGAAARVLCATGRSRLPWGRWALAVLAGYRTMVAYAKLWELQRIQGGA